MSFTKRPRMKRFAEICEEFPAGQQISGKFWKVIDGKIIRKRKFYNGRTRTVQYLLVECVLCGEQSEMIIDDLRKSNQCFSCFECSIDIMSDKHRKEIEEKYPVGYRFPNKSWTVIGGVTEDMTVNPRSMYITKTGNQGLRILVQCDCGNQQAMSVYELESGKGKGCRKCMVDRVGGPNNKRWKGTTGSVIISGAYLGALIKAARVKEEKLRAKGIQVEPSDITPDYLVELYHQQNGKCAYTGTPLTFRTGRQKGNASLDRIDSNKSYIKGNVQWVIKIVNQAKNSLTHKEFLALVTLIYQNSIAPIIKENM